jgi:CRISPR-associated endonuclease Cas1
LAWLSEHNIPLIQINWRGEIINVVSEIPEKTISDRLKFQLIAKNGDGGLKIALKLISQKISNSIDTLQHALPKSGNVDLAIKKLENEFNLLKRNPPQAVSHLMGVEGRVGYAYFDAWRTCRIKWKGIDRNPIPDDWYQIGRRSSKLGNASHPNRNATQPTGALLNYAYGILESQVRMQVVAAGLDPTIGILHGNARGQHGARFRFNGTATTDCGSENIGIRPIENVSPSGFYVDRKWQLSVKSGTSPQRGKGHCSRQE